MGHDTDTSIKVSLAARERLGILAAEHGTTIRALVEQLAAETPTRADLRARGEIARGYLREHMGVEVTAEDQAAGRELLDTIARRMRGGPGGAAS
ncbi:hypothetical protein [Streptomyces sp. B8F3]|uniref:hypothetical protein n=1 Tax=unclassified Streptomyces TaxID=2593676 RepID=UPI00325CD402